MAGEMQVLGLKELERDLRHLPRRVQGRVVRNATRAGAVEIRREAKSRVPVATGTLRKGVILRSQRSPDRNEVRVAIGPSTDVFYGMFLEFGTSRQGARPWLRPAFDTAKERAAKAVIERVWQVIARELKR